jgi:hypothetical protein
MTVPLWKENVYRCSTRRGTGTGVRKIEINNVSKQQQRYLYTEYSTYSRTGWLTQKGKTNGTAIFFGERWKYMDTCD